MNHVDRRSKIIPNKLSPEHKKGLEIETHRVEIGPQNKHYKIILMGDVAVGKTLLRMGLMGESHKNVHLGTIGADFSLFTYQKDKEKFHLGIWDLAGSSKFKDLRPKFYSGTSGAILCFDSTRPDTFESRHEWIEELTSNTHTSGAPLVIITTKSDILCKETYIPDAAILAYIEELEAKFANQFYKDYKIPFYKTSAITGENIENVFIDLINSIDAWFASGNQPYES